MVLVERSAEKYLLLNDELAISYRYTGDRWRHDISVLCPDGREITVASDEGADAAGRLTSPALQDLRLEELGNGVFEFQLLGQGNSAIYSAAVRFDGPARRIDFDYCARAAKSGATVCTASRYRICGENLAVEERPPFALALILGQGPAIEFASCGNDAPSKTECRCIDDGTSPLVVIGACAVPETESPKTNIRWRYTLSWRAAAP